MSARDAIEVGRTELYERVWAKPVQTVAAELGISGVALGKICSKLNVPRPPRGHWAKLRHGAKTKRPALPPRAEGQAERIVIDPQVGSLDVAVSAASKGRALALLDALLKGLEKRGHRVEVDASRRRYDGSSTFAVVRGEPVHFRLRELCRQQPREPSDFERRWEPARTYTELVPSGELQLELSGDFHGGVRKTWSDRSRKRKKLEELLGELVLEFEVAADAAKARKAERQRAEEERRRAEAEQEQIRHRQAHQQALVEDLVGMANAWARAERLRAFVEAARAHVDRAELRGPEIDAWFAWAAAVAADVDPLGDPDRIAKRLEPAPEPPRPRWAPPTRPRLERAPGSNDPGSNPSPST